jgi:hypothetical protein
MSEIGSNLKRYLEEQKAERDAREPEHFRVERLPLTCSKNC